MGGHINKIREIQVMMDPKTEADIFHIKNIGKLIEQNEADIRQEMQGVYLNKSKQIISSQRLREEQQMFMGADK